MEIQKVREAATLLQQLDFLENALDALLDAKLSQIYLVVGSYKCAITSAIFAEMVKAYEKDLAIIRAEIEKL